MKKIIVCLLIIVLAVVYFVKKPKDIVDIEFADGLGKGQNAFRLLMKSKSDQSRYALLENVWQANRPAQRDCEGKIPKIIHQIWLGQKPKPSYFAKFRQKIRELHPEWEYRLWTDKELELFCFSMKDLLEKSENFGEKSDILRCEILLKMGGVYIDSDVDFLKSLDPFVERYNFFAGCEHPHEIIETERLLLISNSIIGSVPDHPVLHEWKRLIRHEWKEAEITAKTPIEKVLKRTFFTFGDAVEHCLKENSEKAVIFPATYFCPIKPKALKNVHRSQGSLRRYLKCFGRDNTFCYLNEEACAIHHFSATWQQTTHERFEELKGEIECLKASQRAMREELDHLQMKGNEK
jgi:hypothetical protein